MVVVCDWLAGLTEVMSMMFSPEISFMGRENLPVASAVAIWSSLSLIIAKMPLGKVLPERIVFGSKLTL